MPHIFSLLACPHDAVALERDAFNAVGDEQARNRQTIGDPEFIVLEAHIADALDSRSPGRLATFRTATSALNDVVPECNACTEAQVASGMVCQSQSVTILPTLTRRQFLTTKFAPEPSWSHDGSIG